MVLERKHRSLYSLHEISAEDESYLKSHHAIFELSKPDGCLVCTYVRKQKKKNEEKQCVQIRRENRYCKYFLDCEISTITLFRSKIDVAANIFVTNSPDFSLFGSSEEVLANAFESSVSTFTF